MINNTQQGVWNFIETLLNKTYNPKSNQLPLKLKDVIKFNNISNKYWCLQSLLK